MSKQRFAPAIAAIITALIVAGIVHAQSVGLNFTKDSTLRGTGSSGSALGVNTTTLAGSGLSAPSSTTMRVGGGSGFIVSADQLDADPTYWQRRVIGTCGAGSAMTGVTEPGGVNCTALGTGDIEGVTAGSGLTGGGTSGTVTLAVNIAGASCSPGSFLTAMSSVGLGTCAATTFTSSLTGLAPASGGGTMKFLRADGTWIEPTTNDPCRVSALGINRIDDWNPTGLDSAGNACSVATSKRFMVLGADNNGSFITGINAIDNGPGTTIAVASNGASLPQATINVASTTDFQTVTGFIVVYVTTGAGQQTVVCTGKTSTTFTGCTGGTGAMSTGGDVSGGLPIGTEIEVCNIDGTADDGVVAWGIEDTNSDGNNRINAGTSPGLASPWTDRIFTHTSNCQTFVYMMLRPQSDPAMRRWASKNSTQRFNRVTATMLEFYPALTPAAITGTVSDWNPIAGNGNCDGGTNPVDGTCIAGASAYAADYTRIDVTTQTSAGATIDGMQVYANSPSNNNNGKGQGRVACIHNSNAVGDGDIKVASGGSSQVHYQFNFPDGWGSITIKPRGTQCFMTPGYGWYPWPGLPNPDVINVAGVYTKIGPVQFPNVPNPTSATGLAGNLQISPTGTGVTNALLANLYVYDNRTFDTTAAPRSLTGVLASQRATRASGANPISNIGLYTEALNCTSATSCYAIQAGGGIEYHGLGTIQAVHYVNATVADFSKRVNIEERLAVGGGDFSNTTRQLVCHQFGAPSVNNGSLSASSGNCMGRITGIGANTSTTLTFGSSPGFGTTSYCRTQVEGATPYVITVSTVSATAPVFSCFDMAGVAANCPDFNYECWGK